MLVHKLAPAHRGQRENEETNHSRYVAGNLHVRLILVGGEWSEKRVDLVPAHQNLKKLNRGLKWFQSHIQSRRSQQLIALSQDCVLANSPYRENMSRVKVPRTGVGWGAQIALDQLEGELAVTSSQLPPPKWSRQSIHANTKMTEILEFSDPDLKTIMI